MDNLVDIFSGDAFSVRALTDAIRIVPNTYGLIGQLGLFQEKGVTSTLVAVEIENGVLNLIPASNRRDPAPKNKTGKRLVKPFEVPHFALDDLIYPDDVQNVRAFGSQNLQTSASVVNDRLVAMSAKHDLTLEYLRSGAISGIVLDPSGSTIVNLYTEFGISEKVVDFNLDSDSTDVVAKTIEVKRHIEDNLKGDTFTGVVALCSRTFWDAFISHPVVAAAYAYYQNMQNAVAGMAPPTANPLRDDVRNGFIWQGIVWREYNGTGTYYGTDGTSTTRQFIANDAVRFVPLGTRETFRQYNAPANWMETVNTVGLNKYAKVVPEPGGRHAELLTQSNPLPICLRPSVLVKGTLT
jgi:hypothetical protein